MLQNWNSILATAIAFAMVLFYLTMLIHSLRSDKLSPGASAAWFLFILLVPFMAFFYYAYQYDGKLGIKKHVGY